MGEETQGEFRYRAFLSYSHRDAAAAARLHRRLETYRLPSRLIGAQTARGTVPSRLWPIFRDRDELPAATDLSETVRAALARSDALIILCSPDAAASLWVAEEIRVFRELHPERPILAAILDGDPPDCFPPVLRAVGPDGTWREPLATDLRPESDGRHLGLLKLVAGITGLGLDELVQRDAGRRIRRVTAVTAAAVATMLVMAAMAVVALNARTDAERERAKAEGQIEFMLTDLRERLRGVGRLDIMTAVNRRALAHYEGQGDLRRLAAGSLLRRARVLHAMGEDEVARGDLAAALAAFREAHRTTASLIARDPDDPERIFVHAQSEYWVGRVHELRRNWPTAQRQYARYATAAERLIGIAPRNPDYIMEMGWGALNLGIVELNGRDDALAAERSFARSVIWFRRAAAARPGAEAPLRELANAYAWLADSFYARELWAQSLAARRQEHRIKEGLYRRDPGNVESAYRLAIAERSVARLSGLVGNDTAEADFLQRAYRRSQGLTVRDARNAQWLLLRAKVECDVLRQTSPSRLGLSEAALRQSIMAAAALLESQGNPRVSEIAPCLSRISYHGPRLMKGEA